MSKLPSEVRTMLEETKPWILATCGDKPNAVPIFFGVVKGDELMLCHVYMSKTLENIKGNNNVSVTVINGMQCYQLKGKATYRNDPEIVAEANTLTATHQKTAKGALFVEVEEIFVQSPNDNNGTKLL